VFSRHPISLPCYPRKARRKLEIEIIGLGKAKPTKEEMGEDGLDKE
jgi:hypothetical protein